MTTLVVLLITDFKSYTFPSSSVNMKIRGLALTIQQKSVNILSICSVYLLFVFLIDYNTIESQITKEKDLEEKKYFINKSFNKKDGIFRTWRIFRTRRTC